MGAHTDDWPLAGAASLHEGERPAQSWATSPKPAVVALVSGGSARLRHRQVVLKDDGMPVVVGIAGPGWAVVATDSRQVVGATFRDDAEKLYSDERLAVGLGGDLSTVDRFTRRLEALEPGQVTSERVCDLLAVSVTTASPGQRRPAALIAAVCDPCGGPMLYKTSSEDAYEPTFVDRGTCSWSANPTVAALLDGHPAPSAESAVRLAIAAIVETSRVCSAVGGTPQVAVVSAQGVHRLDPAHVRSLAEGWTSAVDGFLRASP